MKIEPTGTCFDDCLDYLMKNPRWKLAHGICVKDGKPYAHAWLIDGDHFVGIGVLNGNRAVYWAEPKDFITHFKVQKWTEYTVRQAINLNHISGYYGPWRAEYYKLCKDYGAKKDEKSFYDDDLKLGVDCRPEL